jgi:hypothetical protein
VLQPGGVSDGAFFDPLTGEVITRHVTAYYHATTTTSPSTTSPPSM